MNNSTTGAAQHEFIAAWQKMTQRERLLFGSLLDVASQLQAALVALKAIQDDPDDLAARPLAQQASEILTKTGNGVIKTHAALVAEILQVTRH
jgi:hypothetical protein